MRLKLKHGTLSRIYRSGVGAFLAISMLGSVGLISQPAGAVSGITQTSPTSDNINTSGDNSFSYALTFSGASGPINVIQTAGDTTDFTTAPSGLITANNYIAVGSYSLSGMVSDGTNNGTWTLTVTVSAGTISQTGLTTDSVGAASSGSYSYTLGASGNDGAVTYTTGTTGGGIVVSSSGVVTTTGTLSAGTYSASGTDADAYGGGGTWSFSLSVTTSQAAPTTGTSTPSGSTSFTDQLTTTGTVGAVSYTVTSSVSSCISVSNTGAITTSCALMVGTYGFSGTYSDANSNTGNWSYTLTINPDSLAVSPSGNSTTVGGSASFTDQLSTTGGVGPYTYTYSSPSSCIAVSSTGAIYTSCTLSGGTNYTLVGTSTDNYGDTVNWSYTLSVVAGTFNVYPTTGATTVYSSNGFSDQLNTTGNMGTVSFSQGTSSSGCLSVSSTGAVAVNCMLSAGTYTATGTARDAYNDTANWSYTLTVNPSSFSVTPTAGATSVAGSTSFSGQLVASGNYGAVSYTQQSTTNPCLSVSGSGAIAVSCTLAQGADTVSGTATDAYGDTANWSYTLTVTPSSFTVSPTSGSTSVAGSSTFTDQLNGVGSFGAVSYTSAGATSPCLSVSSTGAVAVSCNLPVGSYSVNGTATDAYGDTASWGYTLSVSASTFTVSPTSGSVSVTNSAGFSDQLNGVGSYGVVTYSTSSSSNACLTVSSSGAVAVSCMLSVGTYAASGTATDAYGDSGSWSYTLTVKDGGFTVGPYTGSTTVDNSLAFTDQLSSVGANGAVSYSQGASDSPCLTVSSTGAVSLSCMLSAGNYTTTGTATDAYGDTASWGYLLTVSPSPLGTTPTTGTTSVGGSSSFSDQLVSTGVNGGVGYTQSARSSACLAVNNTGVISVSCMLSAGSYTISGTAVDAYGDTGSWTYTLTVKAGSLTQTSSTSVGTTGGSQSTFTLTASGANGAVSWALGSSLPNGFSFSGGVITQTAGAGAGTYHFTGTMIDAYGDTGTWTLTVSITSTSTITITPQGNTISVTPTSGTTTAGTAFYQTLVVSGAIGNPLFTPTGPSALGVDSFGYISAPSSLAPGIYTISGSVIDSFGDTGTWSFSLTVKAKANVVSVADYTGKAFEGGHWSPAVSDSSGALGSGQYTLSSANAAVCSVNGAVVSFNSLGLCAITAAVGAHGVYGAGSETVTLSIGKVSPVTYGFTQTPGKTSKLTDKVLSGIKKMVARTEGSGFTEMTITASRLSKKSEAQDLARARKVASQILKDMHARGYSMKYTIKLDSFISGGTVVRVKFS